MSKRFITVLLVLVTTTTCYSQQKPTTAAAEWWRLSTALSSDAMEGRDTGTQAYERAATFVEAQFKASGLKPAGDNGTYFQRVAMHQVDLDTAHSSIELVELDNNAYTPLALLYETTVAPRADLPAFMEGQLVFTGYGVPPTGIDLHGKVAVYFNNTPSSMDPAKRTTFAAARVQALVDAGVVGLISIDNPAAIEPTHWPAAYARSVTLKDAVQRPLAKSPVAVRISAEAAPKLFAGANGDAAKVLLDAQKGLPLPSMTLARKLRVSLKTTEKDISSPNILAILPGSDPTLAAEYVAVSAHLDGYGYGTPVMGDNLYNGALDDAAYVATLLEMTAKLSGKPGLTPKRSLLVCIFTGEEKGLLGSVYFTQHPTVPVPQIVANFNLDQLRPIFPLKILTMQGIADSSLGDTARSVAKTFGIELRPDRETERNLFRRADNYSFVRIGVPIASFIFGYDAGTESERIYRDWYARRYHKPQDDLATPIDWTAAVMFNDFYRALVLKVANDPARPQWIASSAYAPKP